jgi:hypothetical protein
VRHHICVELSLGSAAYRMISALADSVSAVTLEPAPAHIRRPWFDRPARRVDLPAQQGTSCRYSSHETKFRLLFTGANENLIAAPRLRPLLF